MNTIAMLPNGDLQLTAGTTVALAGAAWARQRIETDLSLFLGEYFLNVTLGVPYYRDILVKNPNLESIRSTIANEIRAVPGVVAVTSITISPPDSDRHAVIVWEAVYADGTVLAGQTATPGTDDFGTFDESFGAEFS